MRCTPRGGRRGRTDLGSLISPAGAGERRRRRRVGSGPCCVRLEPLRAHRAAPPPRSGGPGPENPPDRLGVLGSGELFVRSEHTSRDTPPPPEPAPPYPRRSPGRRSAPKAAARAKRALTPTPADTPPAECRTPYRRPAVPPPPTPRAR